jgi:hypothetical protein
MDLNSFEKKQHPGIGAILNGKEEGEMTVFLLYFSLL